MNASAIARALGRRGGLSRGRLLTRARKQAIAAMGAQARLRSLEAEKNIMANFRYAEAVRQLRGESTRVKRLKQCTGRLPGLYADGS